MSCRFRVGILKLIRNQVSFHNTILQVDKFFVKLNISMSDFEFLQNKVNGKWVISAPRRAKRTNVSQAALLCPFCIGQEVKEEELYRVGLEGETDWKIRVITNKFPFAPFHEIIIHSPDHHKNWDELPFSQVELILRTYRERYNVHKKDRASLPAGRQVYILHNSGSQAGASLSHPHSQLVVIPQNVKMDISPLDPLIKTNFEKDVNIIETEHFLIFCPQTSEWPDEVWLAPRQNGGGFGYIKDLEITDMGYALSRLIQIFTLRHGHEFPFNFYIPPLKNWYLRLIPRTKIIGGFELGTNIIVNTQDPVETFKFIQEHFWQPDHEKIRGEHQADYEKSV